jgi:hypothetical protein
MQLDNLQIKGVLVRFAFEKQDIWITVIDILKVHADDPAWAIDAPSCLALAQRNYPKAAAKYFRKLPVLLGTGKISTQQYWHYHVNADLTLLRINQENGKKLDKLIHTPIRSTLRNTPWGRHRA